MRNFLLTIFWVTAVGSVIQVLIILSASWIILSGPTAFSELTLDVYIAQYIPVFDWIRTLISTLLGELGHWILALPILVISPLKLVAGTLIGLWAYSAAKLRSVKPA